MANGDLQHAIQVATRAYDGRTDRQGEPYVAHAIRVMLDVEGDEARAAAILHDVLEWGSISRSELLAERFPRHIIEAVEAMTSREGEPLEASVGRVRQSELAMAIKIADLRDNALPWRLDSMPDDATRSRLLTMYRRSAQLLGTSLDEICGRSVA